MSPLVKLAGFASLLALVFGGAALAGNRADVDPVGPAAEEPGMSAMGDRPMAPAPVRGLAVSADGLTLELRKTTAAQRREFALAFRIVDRRGQTVTHFDVEHTKRMHVIVVRRDTAGFQHVHPTMRADGTWTVPLTLRDAGTYRVFADFATGGTAHTLAGDLTVDGTVRSEPLPAPTDRVRVDGLDVSLARGAAKAGAESELAFTVSRRGRPVAVQEYLGAQGHLVALRRGDLAFLHVHPDERRLRFMATFPSAGTYRLFLQFKTEDGRLHTAAFTEEVSR